MDFFDATTIDDQDQKLFDMDLTQAPDFLSDGWSASPDDLLDSFMSLNGDFLRELDDSQNMQFNAISEANNATDFVPTMMPPTPTMTTAQQQTTSAVDDFPASFMHPASGPNQIDLSEYINFGGGGNDEPAMSSSSSDSGLSSDNMEMDLSPDYEPLSPAMSSPGPSISERGGKNSPARSLVSEPGHAYVTAPPISNVVAAAAAPLTMTIAAPEPTPAPIVPRIQVSVQPQQQQQLPQPQQSTPPQQLQQKPTAPRTTPIATAVAAKPRTIVFSNPTMTTATTPGTANVAAAKPRYVIEKTAGGSTIIVSDGVKSTPTAVAVKRPAPVQAPQSVKKEMKIYKMSPAPVASTSVVATPQQQPQQSQQQQQQQQPPKKLTIQMRDGATKTVSTTAGTTYVINKTSAGQFAGVRKLVRVQGGAAGPGGVGNAARSILLPVSFQDVKDFRTIKIINASNLNNKSANIKLAAANMLQQSKQGLVQKNVLFSKEQLIDDSLSDPCTSDAESYVFEDVLMQASSSGSSSKASSVVSAVSSAPAPKPTASLIQRTSSNVIINRGPSNAKNTIVVPAAGGKPHHNGGGRHHHSDADDDDDDDDEEGDDDEDGATSDYMNGQSTGMSPNGTYPKLLLTNEERRLLDKEGIQLPGNYPLTKHEERELKRIRRKIRNKISAQDSRKRKKEYVDGLEERVKQCTDENQTLIKRLKLLQSQHTNLSHQVKKLQAMLSKTGAAGGLAGAVSGAGGKMTQPATCLMVLLLSLALVAAPNLKLGQNDKDMELAADALQESLLLQQNRRNLLFDPSEQQQLGDGLVDEDIMLDDAAAAAAFGGDANEHDYAGGATTTTSSALVSKMPKTFVDFDLDDTLWKPPSVESAATGDAKTPSLFAERAAGFQDSLRAAVPHIVDFEHSVNGAKMVGVGAGGMYEMKLEPMDYGGGAASSGGELQDAKKLNESKVPATGERQTILMKGA